MRRVRYQVACSLDGFIAGPNDDFDWIPPEPTFDFEALYVQFDTLSEGRMSDCAYVTAPRVTLEDGVCRTASEY